MIPNYTLYGDENIEAFPDILHCESIAERSGKHDWKIAPHRHHILHQFFWIASGGGVISIDGYSHTLAPQTVISLPPLCVHGFEFVQDTKGWVVTVPNMIMAEALHHAPELEERLEHPFVFSDQISLQVYFEQISNEYLDIAAGRQQRLVHLSGLLSIEVARLQTGAAHLDLQKIGKQHQIVQNFLALLEENFRALHSVANYAERLSITPPHLTRSCRHVTGKSTLALIQDRIILEAKRSLVYSRMPISEIAYSLGFDDPAHFSKFFQRSTAVRPSRFRQLSDEQVFTHS